MFDRLVLKNSGSSTTACDRLGLKPQAVEHF
jgi:hypothetical protein